MAKKTIGEAPVTIKKYANRRLYNTATSSYVTLDHLCQMVKNGEDFVVYDAKTGEDITRSVLTQIIFEEEGKGQNLLPIRFLRQLIRFYGDQLQGVLPNYLELSMESFAKNQEQVKSVISEAFSGKNPLRTFEELARQNFQLFERAIRAFSPFAALRAATGDNPTGELPSMAPVAGGSETEISALRAQIEAMQRQLDGIAKKAEPEKAPTAEE
ncbi:polyhydroxyalkanoate synthesis repressor PhaR [Zavarzinia compransoris]|uniref:polyhydroxyalkanoate synthesis repressor PhaR n=1 Tax=Zavarzinia compransoris TaxID=1264899 RepID=UPI0010EAA92A|nr:polyhydroxyalkanoate synthesis repressor PhaR [Zavarzinia compransoris]TDP48932.1 polyhydroxyalkanoate synthesis repressor PhaR [Zavarzinia compransoris]